jgi:hypothetical protein
MEAVMLTDLKTITESLVNAAKGGDTVAVCEVLDRTIGKLSQSDAHRCWPASL